MYYFRRPTAAGTPASARRPRGCKGSCTASSTPHEPDAPGGIAPAARTVAHASLPAQPTCPGGQKKNTKHEGTNEKTKNDNKTKPNVIKRNKINPNQGRSERGDGGEGEGGAG